MKLTNETEELISSTSKKQSQFTIQASTKAFSILSDKLYSNKILAVIREYVANAFDAHLEADNKIIAPSNYTKPLPEGILD